MSITDELRKWLKSLYTPNSATVKDEGERIADRIDAEHDKALNSVDDAYGSGYNVGYDEGFASADDWLAQHEDAMAEHGWVRRNKEHVISHATVEVTPHIDWSRMADELDEFVEIVRGMALAEGEDA